MTVRILSYDTGLLSLLREIQYPLARATQEPLAAIYIPTFQSHREDWQIILLKEIALLDYLWLCVLKRQVDRRAVRSSDLAMAA